jgi:hypothetical protein
MPTWEDYLRLSFDEIRQFGSRSVQVIRRLRSAHTGVAEAIASEKPFGIRQLLDVTARLVCSFAHRSLRS